jgi:predicted metal-dependent enzyme (double-stranded beta helix superfamily)
MQPSTLPCFNEPSIIPNQKAHNNNNEQKRTHPRTTLFRILNEGTERSITLTVYGNAIKKNIQRRIFSIVAQSQPALTQR